MRNSNESMEEHFARTIVEFGQRNTEKAFKYGQKVLDMLDKKDPEGKSALRPITDALVPRYAPGF